MFPAHNNVLDLSMTEDVAPPLPGSNSSSDNATAQRPSIRVLDQQSKDDPLTREEDLKRGPLLYSIGGSFNTLEHDLSAIDPNLILEATQPAKHRGDPEIPLHSVHPLHSSRQLPMAFHQPSLPSESSATGPSLSIPLDDTLSKEHLKEHSQPDVDPGSGTVTPHARDRTLCVPWNFEFEWDHQGLCFGGDRFFADAPPQTTSVADSLNNSFVSVVPQSIVPDAQTFPSSGQGSGQLLVGATAGMGEWAASLHRTQNDNESCSTSFTSDVLYQTAYDTKGKEYEYLAQEAWENTLDSITQNLYSHYIRSYAPQKSGRKENGGMSASSSRQKGTAGSRTTNRDTLPTRREKKGRRSGKVEGDGNSEDEDSENDWPWPSQPVTWRSTRYPACPFLRYSPGQHRNTCPRKLRTITNVKAHILKFHFRPYCGVCYQIIAKEHDHKCDGPVDPPICRLTIEKAQAIEQYPTRNRNKSFSQKLNEMYNILFPNHRTVWGPFLADVTVGFLDDAEEYLNSQDAEKIIRQSLEEEGYVVKNVSKICKRLLEHFPMKLLPSSDLILSRSTGLSATSEQSWNIDESPQTMELDQALAPEGLGSYSFVDMDIDGSHSYFDITSPSQLLSPAELEGELAQIQEECHNQEEPGEVFDWHAQNASGQNLAQSECAFVLDNISGGSTQPCIGFDPL